MEVIELSNDRQYFIQEDIITKRVDVYLPFLKSECMRYLFDDLVITN